MEINTEPLQLLEIQFFNVIFRVKVWASAWATHLATKQRRKHQQVGSSWPLTLTCNTSDHSKLRLWYGLMSNKQATQHYTKGMSVQVNNEMELYADYLILRESWWLTNEISRAQVAIKQILYPLWNTLLFILGFHIIGWNMSGWVSGINIRRTEEMV